MFKTKNKLVLYFYEDNLDLIRYVWTKNNYVLTDKQTISINDEQVVANLIEAKIATVDVFIPDDECYLKLLSLTPRREILQTDITKEVENFIPENVDPKKIFWNRIGSNEDEIVVSVRVIKNNYLKKISDFLEKVNIRLEKYIFESDAIAKNREKEEFPEIIINNKKINSLLVVTYKGNVWQSVMTTKEEIPDLVDQIKSDFVKKWKVKIEKVTEEKSDIFEILPNQIRENNNYNPSANLLIKIIIIVGLIILFIFVPMIVNNVIQIQNNQNKIQNLKK